MPPDFLATVVKQKKRELAAARKATPQDRLAELARQRSDFRPFWEPLSRPGPAGVNIIAEIKRASPSRGDIRPDLDAGRTAAQYESGGAVAVSVLTDRTYFKGSLDDLAAARSACGLPLLRKEFIISRYQVYEAAAAGADAILLIARLLNLQKLEQLYALGRQLGMAALVEIHTPEDARKAVACGARLVGINNRNLATLETDITRSVELVSLLAPGQIAVAASGISGPADIQSNCAAGIFNFLVGESIVRSDDPVRYIRRLTTGTSPAHSSGDGAA
jgi:indole-3-glycerol phosphate synthase